MAELTQRAQRNWRWRGRTAALAIVALLGPMVIAAPVDAKRDKPKPVDPSDVAADLPLGSMYHVVDQIGARALWDAGITGAGINVAVIDTGVANVPALRGPDKVVAMVDLSGEAAVPQATYRDTYGHGTHIAGIIAGRDPAADPARSREHPEWFLGVAPGAGLIPVKVGDNNGDVDVSQVIAGVDWVVEHADELDIRVLNLSFSSDSIHSYLTDPLTYAVERAWDAGIVVVVAAGNDGLGQLRLGVPANDPRMIAVGGLRAIDGGFEVPDWASNGNGVRNPDVGAPGAHILGLRSPGSRVDLDHPEARVGSDLFLGSGSSQAAAVTSGAAALLLSANPRLNPDQVKALLRRSADATVLGLDGALYAGDGLVRVDRALRASKLLSSQLHPRALGTGSLEDARGSVHIELFGVDLVGEVDVLGNRWVGPAWNGARWSDGVWDGARWSGGEWRGARWSDARWTGGRWVGARWSGVEWEGARWSDEAWASGSWSGARWSGARWSDATWSGARWSGARWSQAGWQ